ncbi:hypothetical protein P3G55_20770 [Leptospira sp. 96542]|nr:hypothetical protein [Leptospira sp. 96542]
MPINDRAAIKAQIRDQLAPITNTVPKQWHFWDSEQTARYNAACRTLRMFETESLTAVHAAARSIVDLTERRPDEFPALQSALEELA